MLFLPVHLFANQKGVFYSSTFNASNTSKDDEKRMDSYYGMLAKSDWEGCYEFLMPEISKRIDRENFAAYMYYHYEGGVSILPPIIYIIQVEESNEKSFGDKGKRYSMLVVREPIEKVNSNNYLENQSLNSDIWVRIDGKSYVSPGIFIQELKNDNLNILYTTEINMDQVIVNSLKATKAGRIVLEHNIQLNNLAKKNILLKLELAKNKLQK